MVRIHSVVEPIHLVKVSLDLKDFMNSSDKHREKEVLVIYSKSLRKCLEVMQKDKDEKKSSRLKVKMSY